MTQEEIQERSDQIAIMLGSEKKNDGQFDYWTYDHLGYDTMKISGACWVSGNFEFHSDYNWLMEAVKFIESKKHTVHISGNEICIDSNILSERNVINGGTMNSHNEKYYPTLISITEDNLTKIEAVFIAVSSFAKLYNEKKL
jgi:hypothetical protein